MLYLIIDGINIMSMLYLNIDGINIMSMLPLNIDGINIMSMLYLINAVELSCDEYNFLYLY